MEDSYKATVLSEDALKKRKEATQARAKSGEQVEQAEIDREIDRAAEEEQKIYQAQLQKFQGAMFTVKPNQAHCGYLKFALF